MAQITIPRDSPLKIRTIMRLHWKAKEPFHLVGEPSTVKSALIKTTSREICSEESDKREFLEWSRISVEKKKEVLQDPSKYFIFEDLRASETDIGELRLQEMNNEDNYITYKYNLLFKVLSNTNSKGVLFFDEMNLANNMIKAQFYKVYNDRSIGDMPISDNVLVCSAGNESSQVRDVVQDSVALTTRRGNYFINPLTSEEFVEYGLMTNVHTSIIGYLSFAPQDVHDLKYDLPDPIGQPCARTWEKLSNIRNNNTTMTLDEISLISRGLIGPSIATKYVSYVKLEKSIKLEDVIKDPSVAKGIKEIQIVYAVVTGLLAKLKQGDSTIFPVICKVSLNIKEEIAVYMMRLTKQMLGDVQMRKYAFEKYPKEFDLCFKKYGDLLRS